MFVKYRKIWSVDESDSHSSYDGQRASTKIGPMSSIDRHSVYIQPRVLNILYYNNIQYNRLYSLAIAHRKIIRQDKYFSLHVLNFRQDVAYPSTALLQALGLHIFAPPSAYHRLMSPCPFHLTLTVSIIYAVLRKFRTTLFFVVAIFFPQCLPLNRLCLHCQFRLHSHLHFRFPTPQLRNQNKV